MRTICARFACAAILTPLTIGMAGPAFAADPARVVIDAGQLEGTVSRGVASFKGIPYAAPPVGKLRWRVPQPVDRWTGIRAAKEFGPSCMQTDKLNKSEDCLTLNVWRPTKASADLRPVMVWIYGGALVRGNTPLYPADALAAQGVVVVTLNYRLGRLGFFAHPALLQEAPEDPVGNYGYMDQLAALKWVRTNIKVFGGDPGKVTIFGESAGGGSVMAHLVSPLSTGLFRAAILQSPGIPTARDKVLPLTSLAEAEKTAVSYATSLGVPGNGPDALEKLRALPAEKLVEGGSGEALLADLARGRATLGLAGSILDGKFLTETPEQAFAKGDQAKVPIIIGANDRDLGLGQAASKDALFALFGTHADEARKLYDPKDAETLDELKQQVFADRTLVEPSRHLADVVASHGQPVWWYRFSYVAEALRKDPKWKGTPHGFEIPYTFDLPAAVVKDKVSRDDKAMGKLASGYWTDFAKTGNPNGGERPEWPKHDPAKDQVINFTNHGIIVGPDPLKERLDLWQLVFEGK